MKHLKYILFTIIILTGFACKERFEPNINSTNQQYLVVEGVLNVGGPTSISLTRTSPLNTTGFTGITNAQVIVEGRDNTTRQLTHAGNGSYVSPNLNLILATEYRLRIRTVNGKEYLSDYVIARQTPPIDSIGWKRNNQGVRVYVNTDDPSGNTRYYRWDFDETWEIRAYYYSRQIYIRPTNTVRDRTPAEDVHFGWKYNISKNIVIGSSAHLTQDIMFEAPVTFINKGDEKLSVRYSILLRQYAMDKAGYEFYDLMKKNTETLGTIFDPQPSELFGNIKCITDPNEPVIGYVSASTISEKRVFISNTDLPGWGFLENCKMSVVTNHPDSLRLFFANGGLGPIDPVYHDVIPNLIVAYTASTLNCVDVTARAASLIRPSYW